MMPEQKNEKNINPLHNIIMEQRKKLVLSGVKDIDSFEEDDVVLQTTLGKLTLRGSGMKMGSFNADTGDLTVSGDIFALVYTDNNATKEGFFSRIFK